MSCDDIVRALRCISTPGDHTSNCEQCPYWKKEHLNGQLKEKFGTDRWTSCDIDKVGLDAADRIEQLAAENKALRKEIEWKDMVIALAQRKQVEAEAERDALIEQIKERHDCLDCKHNDFCEFDGAFVVDCMNCVQEECQCAGCCDYSRWEWRGLTEATEEGGKA